MILRSNYYKGRCHGYAHIVDNRQAWRARMTALQQSGPERRLSRWERLSLWWASKRAPF